MSLVNMGEQFSGLPMENLIGAPLMAAAEANAKMAVTQTNFLLSVGFNKTKKIEIAGFEKNGVKSDKVEFTEGFQPIMVNLTMERTSTIQEIGTDGKLEKKYKTDNFVVPLPLISLIPMNSLAVTNVDIHFEMEVKSASTDNTKTSKENDFSSSLDAGSRWWQPVRISGSVSYSSKDRTEADSQYTKSNSAKYTIDVKAQQLPLPVGVTTIIDVFAKNMEPLPISKPEKEDTRLQSSANQVN